jgi:hypothetical protein
MIHVMATRRAVGKPGKLARGASRRPGGLERNRERKLRNAAQRLRGGGGRRALWRAEAFSERETES